MIKISIENNCAHQEISGRRFDVFGECVMAVVGIANFLEEQMPFFVPDAFYKTVEDERKGLKETESNNTAEINPLSEVMNVFEKLLNREE